MFSSLLQVFQGKAQFLAQSTAVIGMVVLLAGTAGLWFLMSDITAWKSGPEPLPSGEQLRVHAHGAELELAWDTAGQAIGESSVGILQIVDGSSGEQDISLNRSDLRRGSYHYRPLSSHVEFQLSVDSGANERVVFVRAEEEADRVAMAKPSTLPMPGFVLPTATAEHLPAPPSVATWIADTDGDSPVPLEPASPGARVSKLVLAANRQN